MKRRSLLKAAMIPAIPMAPAWAAPTPAPMPKLRPRARPGTAGWPSAAKWQALQKSVGGRLQRLEPYFAACAKPAAAACRLALDEIKNPYAIGDQPALTQTSGWLDAWDSKPSAYALAAESTADIVAAVNFARSHNLRLVVKGGGHSYQGTSDAPDSLLVWTRKMNSIAMHDAFVAQGSSAAPQPAVSLGAGAMWIDAYDAVTTKGGRYVQGGGCATVGVAGLVQSGGFGSFSKNFGTASAGLLEAEVVTADGKVLIANASQNPDLFWALKGGGGGSIGVVTRLTLRTRELPASFGGVMAKIKANSDQAYRALIEQLLSFYASALFNPQWGEQIGFETDNNVKISMVFQGLSQQQATAAWQPMLEWLKARPEYSFEEEFKCIALPARHFWNADFFRQHAPGLIEEDKRPGAPSHHMIWKGDYEQAGWYIHGYKSAWLDAGLLAPARQAALADAIFEASRHWYIGFHFNKGLAGAPAAEIEAARNSAMNPAMLDAFALVIIAGGGNPNFQGMPGALQERAIARQRARDIGKAMDALLAAQPDAGSYLSESDYFLANWQTAFWGGNHQRLAQVKQKYDPQGLFFIRHGVGSERWSDDGFTPR